MFEDVDLHEVETQEVILTLDNIDRYYQEDLHLTEKLTSSMESK